MWRQSFFVVALAEVGRAEVAVGSALTVDVVQGLGHNQILLHVVNGLWDEEANFVLFKSMILSKSRISRIWAS